MKMKKGIVQLDVAAGVRFWAAKTKAGDEIRRLHPPCSVCRAGGLSDVTRLGYPALPTRPSVETLKRKRVNTPTFTDLRTKAPIIFRRLATSTRSCDPVVASTCSNSFRPLNRTHPKIRLARLRNPRGPVDSAVFAARWPLLTCDPCPGQSGPG